MYEVKKSSEALKQGFSIPAWSVLHTEGIPALLPSPAALLSRGEQYHPAFRRTLPTHAWGHADENCRAGPGTPLDSFPNAASDTWRQ